jgi:dTDP-4-dehydrorhamnose reductase
MACKVVILGAGGQMGRAMQAALAGLGARFEIHAFGRDLDICDYERVTATLSALKPDIVINTAAFTAVDACEAEPERATATNKVAAGWLGEVCFANGSALIHLSTDYVFGNDGAPPLTESDPISPLNVYGQSKADGEAAIRAVLPRHIILRTSWIYGPDAGNFFATMMRLAQQRDVVTVVEDEAACPTLARDLAACIVAVCLRLAAGTAQYGTFHAAGAEGLSRLAFANLIMKTRADLGLKCAKVEATTQAAYGAPAQRPLDSRLDCTAFEIAYKTRPRGVSECLPSLVQQIAARTDKAPPA